MEGLKLFGRLEFLLQLVDEAQWNLSFVRKLLAQRENLCSFRLHAAQSITNRWSLEKKKFV